jgi:hypothetical protein
MWRAVLFVVWAGCGQAAPVPVAAPPPAAPAAPAVPSEPARPPADLPPALGSWTVKLASETPEGAFVLLVPPDPATAPEVLRGVLRDGGCAAVREEQIDGADVWSCVAEGRSRVVRHVPGEAAWTVIWGRGGL